MYTLLSGLWKYIFQKDEYCVVIVGLDNAGKTTLLEQLKRIYMRRYNGLSFEKITTTVGLNVGKIDLNHIRMIFWDLGGQTDLQTLWDKYYKESHAVIYVIDSSDKRRLEESYQVFTKLLEDSQLTGVPLLVLANKQDLETSLKAEEVKAVFNRSAHQVGRRDCLVQPVSALSGMGIEDGINWLVEAVQRNIYRPPRMKDIT